MENRKRDTLNKAKEIFLQEVRDRLPEAIEALSILKNEGYIEQASEKLYRFSHTLKGSGQMVNLFDIAEPATEMTVVLLLLKEYGLILDKELLKFLDERMEEIIYQLENYKQTNKPPIPKVQSSNIKKRIFVVDDDPAVTSFIKNSLELKGYDVNVYHDIYQAEENLYIYTPDLIVLDIIMSTEEDGIIFCRKIRSDYNCKLVPIIFLSNKNELKDKLEGFATGADDYLCKPFEIEELAARIQALLKRLETQKSLILQDALTGVYNRRYLEQRLVEEIARSNRINGCFSVAMIDMDYFKSVNDKFGHAAGDEVLQVLVKRINENLRNSDVICRYGGEEFVIILPDTAKDHAYRVIERLRQNVGMKSINLTGENTKIDISISGGISSFPEDGTTSRQLIITADSAMYQAKTNGRNKVLVFKEVNHE